MRLASAAADVKLLLDFVHGRELFVGPR
jgi:hypothetical protein